MSVRPTPSSVLVTFLKSCYTCTMNDGQQNPTDTLEDKEERIGFFPSWNWLYVSVVVYTTLLIGLLYLFTVFLDYSAP